MGKKKGETKEPDIREGYRSTLFLCRGETVFQKNWEDEGMKKIKNEKAGEKASVQGSGSSVQGNGGVDPALPGDNTAGGTDGLGYKGPKRPQGQKGKHNGSKGHLCPTKVMGRERVRGGGRIQVDPQRKSLVRILERHEVSVVGFDTLRADAYEKQLAKRSLADLEKFYSALERPGAGYAEIQADCPAWGKDNKPPSITTLREIKHRIEYDRIIREEAMEDRLAKGLNGNNDEIRTSNDEIGGIRGREREGGRGGSGQRVTEEEYFGAAVRVLGRELLRAKLDGKPIGENLKMFDRLLRVAGFRVRQQKESREQAEFEWFKQGQPITEPEVSPETNDGTQPMINGRTRPSGEDRTDDIIERIYGPNPFKTKPVDPNAKPYLQVVDPASDQPKPAWWTPGTVLIAGPSQKYPKGVRRHVVSGNPHCVATMICVDVESEEFRAIYDETGTAKEIRNPNDEIRNAKGDKAETNKGVQGSVSSVQNSSARATDGNNKDAKGAKAENGKPKWWKPGSILIAGPSAEYPKGVGKDVITGRPYCVATGKAACVENAESKSEKKQPNSEVVKPDMATGKSPEPAGKNACPTSAPQSAPVESLEEYTARKRKEAEQKAWEARQMRIRDKSNGTEKYFYPPGYGPNN